MKLTDAERAKLAAAIKHFEALQKRYTRQHNGTACEYVKMALIGLNRLSEQPEVVRCGECAKSSDSSSIIGPSRICRKTGVKMKPTDFCSYGERRKEPDDEGRSAQN